MKLMVYDVIAGIGSRRCSDTEVHSANGTYFVTQQIVDSWHGQDHEDWSSAFVVILVFFVPTQPLQTAL